MVEGEQEDDDEYILLEDATTPTDLDDVEREKIKQERLLSYAYQPSNADRPPILWRMAGKYRCMNWHYDHEVLFLRRLDFIMERFYEGYSVHDLLRPYPKEFLSVEYLEKKVGGSLSPYQKYCLMRLQRCFITI
jgi:hypothetical protein